MCVFTHLHWRPLLWKHSTFTVSIFLSALIEQRVIFVTHCTLKRHRPLTSFLPSARNYSATEELTEMKTTLKVINHLRSARGFTPLSCKPQTFRSQKWVLNNEDLFTGRKRKSLFQSAIRTMHISQSLLRSWIRFFRQRTFLLSSDKSALL